MKKKILGLSLCLCLILPCVIFLSGCGKKPVNININTCESAFANGVKEIVLADSTSYSSSSYKDYGSIGNDKIGKEITKFEAQSGQEITMFVVLEPGYVINDFKVTPNGYNGTPIEPVEKYTGYASDSWVYEYTIAEELEEELWVVFSGKPALRTQTITLSQSNVDFFDQAEQDSGDPASVFLADAMFSVYYKTGNMGAEQVLTDLTLTQFKEKLASNYSFNVPASSTVSIRVTTGDAAKNAEGHARVLNMYSLTIFDNNNFNQTFTGGYSTLSSQVFEDETVTFDWKEITSSKLESGVFVHAHATFNGYEIKDVTRLDGTSLLANDTPFSFAEFSNYKNTGYYIKFDISKGDYALITDPSTIIEINYKIKYSPAEAIEAGILSFDNVENPTEAWINPKGIELDDDASLIIYISYDEANISQNANFQNLQIKTVTENNNSAPYKFAKYNFSYTDTDADLMFMQDTGLPEEYRNDYTYPVNYNCYYLKGVELTINHLEVGYTDEKTNLANYEANCEGQTFTINFKTTSGVETITVRYVDTAWTADTTTWFTVSTAEDYQHFGFTVNTEALKTALGGDLYEIEIVMPDHVAQN